MDPKSKSVLLMDKVFQFYESHENYTEILKTIIEQKSVISLRLLDWFVTNHAKQRNIHYTWRGDLFNVHFGYKNQLKAFSKRLFDPFCRRQRVYMYTQGGKALRWKTDHEDPPPDTELLVTTVGQLNFFKWAIENNVISYVLKNHNEIESDMIERSGVRRGKDDKRRELSTPVGGLVTRNDIPSVIRW